MTYTPADTYTQTLLAAFPTSMLESPELQNPSLNALPAVQLRPDIEIKIECLALLSLIPTRIKVNHILNLCAAAIHDPVVAIKWRLVSHQTLPARPGRQAGAEAGERSQLGAATGFGAAAFLPDLDFVPGALVDGVVDGDNGTHVWGGGVVGFAAHGVEEHLLRGVDPVSCFFIGAGVALVVRGCLRWSVW